MIKEGLLYHDLLPLLASLIAFSASPHQAPTIQLACSPRSCYKICRPIVTDIFNHKFSFGYILLHFSYHNCQPSTYVVKDETSQVNVSLAGDGDNYSQNVYSFCTTKVSRARDRGNYSLDVYIVSVLFIFFTILGWATLLAKLCGNKPTDGMKPTILYMYIYLSTVSFIG